MLDKEAIFFDLDGTLLPIDMDYFLEVYFKLITEEFSDIKDEDEFIKILMSSTKKMIKNDGRRSNEDVFKNAFFSMIDVENEDEIMKRFDKFYEEKYPSLKEKFELKSKSPDLIDLLKNRDLKLVIATNPLFPKKAIIERINWAGIDADIFDFISCYEEMHYSKPNPKFYKEIIDKLDLEAENCVMIGNDHKEDMIAKKVGMEGYLIEDYLIESEEEAPEPDWQGTMSELIEKINKISVD